MTETVERSYKDEDGEDKTIKVRRVLRATERYSEKDGTPSLFPLAEIEGWWTSLSNNKETIIDLYKGHALCLRFSCHATWQAQAFSRTYNRFAYG